MAQKDEVTVMQTFIQALANGAIEVTTFKVNSSTKGQKTSGFGPCAVAAFFTGLSALAFDELGNSPSISIDGQQQQTIVDTINQLVNISAADWQAVQFMGRHISKATSLLFVGTDSSRSFLNLYIAHILLNGSQSLPAACSIRHQLDELIDQAQTSPALLNTYIAAKCIAPNTWQEEYNQWCTTVFSAYKYNPKIAEVIALDRLSQLSEAAESISQSIQQTGNLLPLCQQSMAARNPQQAYNILGLARSAINSVNNLLGNNNSRPVTQMPSESAHKWGDLINFAKTARLNDLLNLQKGAAT